MLECKYSREIAKGITLDVNDELATKALTEANEFHLVKNYLEEMLHQATKEVKSVKGFMKEFKPNTFQVKTNGTGTIRDIVNMQELKESLLMKLTCSFQKKS